MTLSHLRLQDSRLQVEGARRDDGVAGRESVLHDRAIADDLAGADRHRFDRAIGVAPEHARFARHLHDGGRGHRQQFSARTRRIDVYVHVVTRVEHVADFRLLANSKRTPLKPEQIAIKLLLAHTQPARITRVRGAVLLVAAAPPAYPTRRRSLVPPRPT